MAARTNRESIEYLLGQTAVVAAILRALIDSLNENLLPDLRQTLQATLDEPEGQMLVAIAQASTSCQEGMNHARKIIFPPTP